MASFDSVAQLGWKDSEIMPRRRPCVTLFILENKDPLAHCRMPFLEADVDTEMRSSEAS